MKSIEIRRDLRSIFGIARDQGSRQTCLAFAMSDAHSYSIGEPWLALSAEYLFYHAKQRDRTPYHMGTTVNSIRGAMLEDGQPVETDWPYSMSFPPMVDFYEPPSDVGTLFRRRSRLVGTGFDGLWELIEAGWPVVIGMSLSNAFYKPSAYGVIDSGEVASPYVKHAVLATAIGENGTEKLILVRNSWGETWGLSGYAWLSESYLSPRIEVAMVVG